MGIVGPQQSQVYSNQLLSNVSISWTNLENVMIADQLFPEIQVKFRTGLYFVYDKSKFHVVKDLRTPGTPANIVTYGLSQATYGPLHDHMLKQAVEDETRDQEVEPFNADIDATNNVTERMVLNKEYDAFTQMTSSTNFTGSNKTTLTGTARWDDYANSDPIGDVRTAVDGVKLAILGKRPNTLVITYQVYSVLRNHPQILERIKYSQLGIVTADLLAQIFDIGRVLIPDVVYNTANEAQTDSISYLWGKNVWVVYINPRAAIRAISFGYTLAKGARQSLQWRDPEPDKFQDWCAVRHYYQQFVIAKEAAWWIATVIN